MRPTRPCPWCDATQFGVIEEATIEMISNAKHGWGNVLNVRFEVVVCKGCGATQLFAPTSKGLLDEVRHLPVDVAPAHPFR